MTLLDHCKCDSFFPHSLWLNMSSNKRKSRKELHQSVMKFAVLDSASSLSSLEFCIILLFSPVNQVEVTGIIFQSIDYMLTTERDQNTETLHSEPTGIGNICILTLWFMKRNAAEVLSVCNSTFHSLTKQLQIKIVNSFQE